MKEKGLTPQNKTCNAEQVIQFLTQHPKFFAQHEALLDHLYIPHVQAGSATSLLERLVERQREQQAELEQQIQQMLVAARENEQVVRGLHHLALELLTCDSVDDVVATCRHMLTNEFGADNVVFRLIGQGEQRQGLNFMVLDDVTVKHLSHLFKKRQPVCGRLRPKQRQFLFGDESDAIQSAVLIPLYEAREIGVLAIGSQSEDRFYPGMGTLFINQLGSLVTRALVRHLEMCSIPNPLQSSGH